MSQYPPQDPNYPYQNPGNPYGQPQQPSSYPQQAGGDGGPPSQGPYGQPGYPGYGQPQQPSYPQTPQTPQPPPPYPGYGMPGPSSPYGYPTPAQMPPAGGFPSGPMAPPPASKSKTITAIAIVGVVVALVIVGVFVVHGLTPTAPATPTATPITFAAEWYGPLHYSPASNTTFSPYTAELYLNLSQDNSGSLSGTGKVCVNLNHAVQDVSFTITGTANGSNANMTLRPTSTSDNPVTATASLSGGSMTFSSNDATGATAGTLQKGGASASSSYTSACQALPSVQTGG